MRFRSRRGEFANGSRRHPDASEANGGSRLTTASQQLADVYASTRFSSLPTTAIDDARRAVLDWLGSTLAGSLESPARSTQVVVRKLGTSSDATIFSSERSSAAGAALANGVACHILELDDVHKGSTIHAAAPVISAALAVAEREHVDGRAFLLAVVLGYDAAFRIGEAVNPSHYRFWHPTGTAATFGAAVAACSVLSSSADEMQNALGTAGTQAAGLWEFNADGTMSKHLHPGKAAMNGVLAADLAKVRFSGASKILEGDRGFIRAMSSSSDISPITNGLGHNWKVSENCYKVWSCCGHTHSAIDVALELRTKFGSDSSLDDITSIEIETYGPGYEIVKERNPSTTYEAKFSLAYCVAAALQYGNASLDVFSADHFGTDGVSDPPIASLLARTSISVADDLTAKYPSAWPTRIRLTRRDGKEIRGGSNYPVGNPENPVTTTQLEQKFTSLVAPRFGDDVARRALDAVRSIDSATDVAMVFRDLAPARR
jgi:2-methylcitrate dehydratase PrpD